MEESILQQELDSIKALDLEAHELDLHPYSQSLHELEAVIKNMTCYGFATIACFHCVEQQSKAGYETS